MAFENIGRVWTPESLKEYLSTLTRPDWCQAITLHHTAEPSLAQRPKGFTVKHIENIADDYKKRRKWRSGPHFFIDEDQIFGMSDFRKKGTHAKSFNRFAIGIEVLGNYDPKTPSNPQGGEDPLSGRGLACWKNTAAAIKVLLDWLKLDATQETIRFHRDDKKTNKTCPGQFVHKDWVLNLIPTSVVSRYTGTDKPTDEFTDELPEKPDVGMNWSSWDFRGERWCVPIYEFLIAKGVSPEKVKANFKRGDDNEFYYGEELIEHAYYVNAHSNLKPNDCTWAPAQELMELMVVAVQCVF